VKRSRVSENSGSSGELVSQTAGVYAQVRELAKGGGLSSRLLALPRGQFILERLKLLLQGLKLGLLCLEGLGEPGTERNASESFRSSVPR